MCARTTNVVLVSLETAAGFLESHGCDEAADQLQSSELKHYLAGERLHIARSARCRVVCASSYKHDVRC